MFGACKNALEVDLGYLIITAARRCVASHQFLKLRRTLVLMQLLFFSQYAKAFIWNFVGKCCTHIIVCKAICYKVNEEYLKLNLFQKWRFSLKICLESCGKWKRINIQRNIGCQFPTSRPNFRGKKTKLMAVL